MKIHSGVRDHECLHCGIAFNQKSNLDRHMQRHTGEKLHCSLCEKSFARSDSLRSHQMKVHEMW